MKKARIVAIFIPLFSCHISMADMAVRAVDKKTHTGWKNINFYVLHKRHRLKILLPGARPYRVGLLDGEPFQEPPVLLSGERTYFGRVPGPLETSAVEPFV